MTVRYGARYQRWHTLELEGSDSAEALRRAAELIPSEVLPEADLAELSVAPDPESRAYPGPG